MDTLAQNFIKGYEILERIGTGGFGAVYKAYQSTINREVAIKIILPGFANRPEFIRRFEIEAQVIARLEHPFIVPLYDYWRDPGGAYLVMRWLRGGSLQMKLRREGALAPDTIALMMDQICGGLELAHRYDVIHRDIKPGNILLDEDGNAYLADFGIAKDLTDLNPGLTGADDIVGSLDYISPEQARSEPVTARTDIYSLGVMLYEMLTGQHPFHDCSSVERLYKHINEPMPEIANIDLHLREGVNEVIQKATAKNPADRYEDIASFAMAFRQAINVPEDMAMVLTQREHQVLQRIVDGLSNKEIANELFISLGTVKTYITQIYSKLGVRNRVQAIVRAQELDVLGLGIGSDISQIVSISKLPEPENPYKGLQAFQAADHLDFFGREAFVDKLLDKLRDNSHIARFLAVVGPSGSGKSSVVKAGLIPAIWNGRLPGSDRWFTVEMLPGSHPIDELEVALTRIATKQMSSLSEQLWRDNRGLLRACQLVLPQDNSEVLLIVDQFEELFTHVEDESERQQFLDILLTAVMDIRSRIRVVITLRADFYDRPLYYPEFGDLFRSRVETILPLSAKGLERAIKGPTERIYVTFEESLVAQMVSEMTYHAGALPLLQYALTELFEHRKGRVLTHEAYQRIGGSVGALAKRAETLFAEMNEQEQHITQQMFLRLVTLGEGTIDTRRRVTRSELLAIPDHAEMMDEAIDYFAQYRLLSLDHDPSTRSPTVEVAHEAILSQWERLHNWINNSREDIKMQQQLSRMTADWQNANQDTSYLVSGLRLEQMEAWAEETTVALTENERQFLQSSIQNHDRRKQVEEARKKREAALERRSVQRMRWLVTVFALAAVLSIGLSGFAFAQRNEAQNAREQAVAARETSDANAVIAEQRANENHSLYLTNEAREAHRNGDTALAFALSVEAVRTDETSELSIQFLNEMIQQYGAIQAFEGDGYIVTTVAFSPDGKTLVSGSTGDTLTLWDVTTGEMIRQFEGHTARTTKAAFSPDGTSLISSSVDHTLILWDVATGEMIRRFEGHHSRVYSVAFSADGQTLLSGSCSEDVYQLICEAGGELILWHVATGEALVTKKAHNTYVDSVAFSPNGQYALSASEDSVILWQIADNALIEISQPFATSTGFQEIYYNQTGTRIYAILTNGTILQHSIETGDVRSLVTNQDEVKSAGFIPVTNTFIVASSNDLKLTNAITHDVRQLDVSRTSEVRVLASSPDGRTIITGYSDGMLFLWGINNDPEKQSIRTFTGHKDQVISVAVSPDGQKIIAGGGLWDGTSGASSRLKNYEYSLILWDANTGEILRRFEGHTDNVWDVTFSPDGQHILSASTDKTIILWDANTGEIVRRFIGHQDSVESVSFSQDGQYVLSGAWDKTIILWDANTGEILRRFKLHQGCVKEVVLSPDEQMVLSVSGYGSRGNPGNEVILWDFETGEVIRRFEGHSWWVDGVALSPDWRTAITSSSDATLILWDIETGEAIHKFVGHSGYVLNVAFSPDGRTAFSASVDKTAILWDVATGEIIQKFVHQGGVYETAYSPDGQWVVTASMDGIVRMWFLPDADLLQWAEENRYIRDFTCEQREAYRIEPLCTAETQA